jgi:hypothetical protein
MAQFKFQQGIEVEHGEGDEYIVRVKLPSLRVTACPVRNQVQQAKADVLIAIRNLIDKALRETKAEEAKQEEVKV